MITIIFVQFIIVNNVDVFRSLDIYSFANGKFVIAALRASSDERKKKREDEEFAAIEIMIKISFFFFRSV